MRVLIIDDGVTGDELAHHLKRSYGAETFRAHTLADGLRMRTEIADLDFVVFDLSYPDSNRSDSIECIPTLAQGGVQVFVFTGYEEKELLQKSLDAGASDWFLKGDNHRGGSTLALRMATIFYRTRTSISDADKERISTAILAGRKEQAEAIPTTEIRGSWFLTVNAYVTLSILVLGNLLAVGLFIWSQAGSNALFRKEVSDSSADISVLKTKAEMFHDQNQTSIADRERINKRLDDTDRKFETVRSEMSAGFNRIYDLLLKQQENRNNK
jgi:CheY-like chemotaxis protein